MESPRPLATGALRFWSLEALLAPCLAAQVVEVDDHLVVARDLVVQLLQVVLADAAGLQVGVPGGAGPLKLVIKRALPPLDLVIVIASFAFTPLRKEVPRRAPKPREQTLPYRWSRVVQHHPWRSAISVRSSPR